MRLPKTVLDVMRGAGGAALALALGCSSTGGARLEPAARLEPIAEPATATPAAAASAAAAPSTGEPPPPVARVVAPVVLEPQAAVLVAEPPSAPPAAAPPPVTDTTTRAARRRHARTIALRGLEISGGIAPGGQSPDGVLGQLNSGQLRNDNMAGCGRG